LVTPPTPVAAIPGEVNAAEPSPEQENIQITIQPDQRLQDIAVKYLGGFDLKRLREIQALNPRLTDPNHIEVGQKIWIPSSIPAPTQDEMKPPAAERNLP
jgi:nucleoid-associated protein YgaU